MFVEIEYDDPENDYQRRERLSRKGDELDPVKFRLAIMDDSKRTFRYRQVQVTTTNEMRRTDWIETTETLIDLMDLEE